ncbi:LexA family protein [Megasphaera vaginalis (ex Srinivasan et al. 2021)]|uniref:Peptidase S24-like protein n=1 Tax=Megasphaera vaginalis (ex Srinivasan et al. 2021) TaxID=1111454 RepID=U7UJL7_9FIRM|nr:XRE family transcriptional regulator [Megasphaera vaginalis (ex Srinivasan et al. 2021)]ERT59612.1 peptidase S24-like protein [Megasphaera vaginalis (ex Srinivasan et al. 2021)]
MNSDLGNKKIFAKNLSYYMEFYSKTRNEICKDLGLSYTTFTSWLTGTNYPRIDKIESLAKYFNINKADLIEEKYKTNPSKEKLQSVRIPVLGYVIAGIPIDAIEDILDYEEISAELAATGDFFCLKVKGNSMEPTFTEGDVLVIRQQPDVESNEIAVVLVNGAEGTVKRIKKSSAGITLIGDNVSSFLPVFYTNEEIQQLPVKIIGKVIELRRSF